jgi:predicted RNA-binding Zn ribbon-like protein
MASERPAAAGEALARFRQAREDLYRVLRAVADREPPPLPAVAAVEAAWRDSAVASRFEFSPQSATLAPSLDEAGLDLVLHRTVAAAAALLIGERLDRLKRCHGPRCGWLFLDTSKAGRRRWCDMATCGNDEKARRHAQRRLAR